MCSSKYWLKEEALRAKMLHSMLSPAHSFCLLTVKDFNFKIIYGGWYVHMSVVSSEAGRWE